MQVILLIEHAVTLKLAPDVIDALFGRRERKWIVLPNGLRGYSQARDPRPERPKLQAYLRRLYGKPVGDILYLWRDEDTERRLSENSEHAGELLSIYNSPGLEFSSYLRIEVPKVKNRLASHLNYAVKLFGEGMINPFLYAVDALNASRGFVSKADARPDDFRILFAVQRCWNIISSCFCDEPWLIRRREARKA
jgi:hypothetical protein